MTDGVASSTSEMPLSSFTIELLIIGEKRFIWEVNLCRIIGVLVSVISSDTKQLRIYSTTNDSEKDSERGAIYQIFQGVGLSGWTLDNHRHQEMSRYSNIIRALFMRNGLDVVVGWIEKSRNITLRDWGST
jgi:hypothetical protein